MFGRKSPSADKGGANRSMRKEKRDSMLKKRPLSVDPRSEADDSNQRIESNIAEPNTLETTGNAIKFNKLPFESEA